jgi:hypothetical protein
MSARTAIASCGSCRSAAIANGAERFAITVIFWGACSSSIAGGEGGGIACRNSELRRGTCRFAQHGRAHGNMARDLNETQGRQKEIQFSRRAEEHDD